MVLAVQTCLKRCVQQRNDCGHGLRRPVWLVALTHPFNHPFPHGRISKRVNGGCDHVAGGSSRINTDTDMGGVTGAGRLIVRCRVRVRHPTAGHMGGQKLMETVVAAGRKRIIERFEIHRKRIHRQRMHMRQVFWRVFGDNRTGHIHGRVWLITKPFDKRTQHVCGVVNVAGPKMHQHRRHIGRDVERGASSVLSQHRVIVNKTHRRHHCCFTSPGNRCPPVVTFGRITGLNHKVCQLTPVRQVRVFYGRFP